MTTATPEQPGGSLARVADTVRRNPGYTSAELANMTGIDRYELARRLPEARTASQVMNGPHRPCSITGRTVQTWFPGKKLPEAA